MQTGESQLASTPLPFTKHHMRSVSIIEGTEILCLRETLIMRYVEEFLR